LEDKDRLTRPEDFFPFEKIKHYSNFYQIKAFGYTYTIFVNMKKIEKPAHIGVTGLPSMDYINVAAVLLAGSFGIEVPKSQGVCNSTYHGRIECTVDAEDKISIYELLTEYFENPIPLLGKLDFSFRPHYFPGVTIKTAGHGTITLFNNGSYHIVGVNSKQKALRLHHTLCVIIQHCWRTTAPAMSCVWTAA
jgi:hypothetical protein